MKETLGAGMPSGGSEDTYLFYKTLKVGYTLVYEPSTHVYHKHRHDMPALRRQIYNYSKGHVAYHIMTLLRDKDLRALIRLAVELPLSHMCTYPLGLILVENSGNLARPWALWQLFRRVKREGRSEPYLRCSVNSAATEKSSECAEITTF